MNKTICLDFDGVIHSYISGWQGETNIPDPPTSGCRETICTLRARGLKIVVHSTRCQTPDGRSAIKDYLARHDIEVDEICEHKPPAILYIDDRAIQFTGNWSETIASMDKFTHWLGNNKI
ncbi:MAG: hypothetical protein OEY01_12820 [Desulfobulbaceae bacterium]|nr:hypothetical protein [Desulfobulbaceae bacterium]